MNQEKKIILYLIFVVLEPNSGITNKILSQQRAFAENGYNCCLGHPVYENGKWKYLIEGQPIAEFGKGIIGKIKSRLFLKPIYNWIELHSKDIEFIYIRYTQFANLAFCKLFRKVNKLGLKIVLEIPTYPYDKEIAPVGTMAKLNYFVEKKSRDKLFGSVFRIATYSKDNEIAGTKTIKIFNSVDLEQIPLKKINHKNNDEINLIGVASIEFWHGYDRMIDGLIEYYKSKPNKIVKFHIVGGNPGNRVVPQLQKKIKNSGMEEFVIFHGQKSGIQLDDVFENCDIAIGSLGRHRTGNHQMQSLKNIEYASRGIPFIYSENNEIFDDKNYILKMSSDDSPIEVQKIVDFFNNSMLNPEEIRYSVKDYTWKNQMNKIIDITLNS